jgi:hypothetical protein
MRLLNLAVPILYRDVVNVLSDASAIKHPREGEVPGQVSFWHVRERPCVGAFLWGVMGCVVHGLKAPHSN